MSNKLKLFVALCAAMAVSLLCVVGCAGGETKHNYSEKWETNADEHWHACADDGCSEVADKAAHTYDDGVVTKNATCSEAGEKTFTCAVCGYKKTETIVVTAHDWNNGVVTTEATCYREGVTTYTCTVCSQTKTETIDKTDHVYETEWDYDDEKHWHNCENKNNGCTAISGEAAHTWNNDVVTTEPTFEAAGEKTFTCKECGAKKTEPVAQKAHSYAETWSSDDTHHWHACTDVGYDTLREDEAEHTWGEWETVTSPTLEADGTKKHTCTLCSKEITTAMKFEETLEDYVVVQNNHLGAANNVTSFDGKTYNTVYNTTSVAYKAKITGTDTFGIRIRETSAWHEGYLFTFTYDDGGKINYPDENGESKWSAGNLFESGDVLEVGIIDIKNNDTQAYIYLKVNDEIKFEYLTKKVTNVGKCITVWKATFEQVDNISYKEAVVTTNNDLGIADGFKTTAVDGWYKSFGYTGDKEISSMVYKFNYTNGNATFVGLRGTINGWDGYQFIFNDGNIQCGTDSGSENNNMVIVGSYDKDNSVEIEIGALDFADETGWTYLYVKVNGELKGGAVFRSFAADKTGKCVNIWSARESGSFGQVEA